MYEVWWWCNTNAWGHISTDSQHFQHLYSMLHYGVNSCKFLLCILLITDEWQVSVCRKCLYQYACNYILNCMKSMLYFFSVKPQRAASNQVEREASSLRKGLFLYWLQYPSSYRASWLNSKFAYIQVSMYSKKSLIEIKWW